jgi:hypothetical protein
MKKVLFLSLAMLSALLSQAQLTYTMGYEKADIEVVDPGFFSTFEFPGQPALCGVYDGPSHTFYTCDSQTYRYVETDYIRDADAGCCTRFMFDPRVYYGTLTLKGYIEQVDWDGLNFWFKTDKARIRVETDEREIDALYEKFYKENYLGKVHLILRLKTYDTPKEAQLSYNLNTETPVKPQRVFTRVLRW